jgi:hypothetical protein
MFTLNTGNLSRELTRIKNNANFSNETTCTISVPISTLNTAITALMIFFLPLLLLLGLSVKMAKAIREKQKISQQLKRSKRVNYQQTITVVIFNAVYFVFSFPHFIPFIIECLLNNQSQSDEKSALRVNIEVSRALLETWASAYNALFFFFSLAFSNLFYKETKLAFKFN